jgi:hypothetical protein
MGWLVLVVASALGLVLVACDGGGGPGGGDDDDGADTTDTDGDGLTDSFEEAIGTDPAVEDSDGDTYLDGDEYLAYYLPWDEADYPRVGQYPRYAQTENIVATGIEEGDTVSDFSGADQYADTLHLYEFYGSVVLIEISADW